MIYSLYIVNKSGGLIYQNDVNPGLNKLTANEYLVLAGTVHGVFAIASKITPTALKITTPAISSLSGSASSTTVANSNYTILSNYSKNVNGVSFVNSNTSGLRSIETKNFSMYVLQTLTGLKLLLVSSPNSIGGGDLNRSEDVAESVLRRIYSLYSDYVMKNPFYSLEMPIRVELFDQKITELIKSLS